MKITSQRLLVAEKIFRIESHFTVDSLAEALKDRRGEISRATIYRIVSLMVESGQLTEHNFGQTVKHYEHTPNHEHHDHIVCMVYQFRHGRIGIAHTGEARAARIARPGRVVKRAIVEIARPAPEDDFPWISKRLDPRRQGSGRSVSVRRRRRASG